jgi:hypothetical protein
VTTNLVKQIAEKMRRIRIPVLDRYMMTEMIPVFVMAVGLCSIVGMTLGALAGLVREVVVSGIVAPFLFLRNLEPFHCKPFASCSILVWISF